MRLVFCFAPAGSRLVCVYICELKETAINVQTEEQSTAGAMESYQGLSCNN